MKSWSKTYKKTKGKNSLSLEVSFYGLIFEQKLPEEQSFFKFFSLYKFFLLIDSQNSWLSNSQIFPREGRHSILHYNLKLSIAALEKKFVWIFQRKSKLFLYRS